MKPENNHQPIEMNELLPFLKEMLSGGKTVHMTVTGNSMFPLLCDRRDSVLLTGASSASLYDVVLFVRETGEAVMHRVIKVTPEGYTILGDNQFVSEGPIKPEQIVAKAIGFYRGGHFISEKNFLYRAYSIIWSKAIKIRHKLLPVVVGLGRFVKRIKGWR